MESKKSPLDYSQFLSPDSFYFPGYMWILNDVLSEKETEFQLKDMTDHKALTVMPMPEPKEFRPFSMPTRLDPPYLSDSYLNQYKFAVKKAQELGMRVWLYDEGAWPSGSVCGKLTKLYPQYKNQVLDRNVRFVAQGADVLIPKNCLAAYLFQGSKLMKRLAPMDKIKITISDARIILFRVRHSGGYPDLLNPKMTQTFIHMVHDEYKRVIANEFGTTVTIVFTDEPCIKKFPWTDGFAEDFRVKKGYDILDFLPFIYEGKEPNERQVRIDYYDWWSNRFADAYFGEIQNWCHSNHLLSGGHLDNEDETLGAVKYGYGHVLRQFRKMDVPGVDVIWRQIWPGKKNHHFPKFASTVAHQEGTRWALSESFAVYGSGLTPAQMKWVINYQLVRGINLFTLVGYPYSTKDWFIGGERPSMGVEYPLWNALKQFHTYIGRLSYLLTCGSPLIHVAVYYPVCDLWVSGAEAERAAISNDRLVEYLLTHQCDFDFIDDDVLAISMCEDGFLFAKSMQYDTIYVSKAEWMPAQSKAVLEQFIRVGGKVFWIDNNPSLQSPTGSIRLAFTELNQYLEPIIRLRSPNNSIRCCGFQLSNGNLYFISNEDTTELNFTAQFSETASPIIIDPELGISYTPEIATYQNGFWNITFTLPFAGSIVLFFSHDTVPMENIPPKSSTPLLQIDTGWSARKSRSFIIQKHGIKIIDFMDTTFHAISLGDWRPIIGNDFSGEVEYMVSFTCDMGQAQKASILDLGDVQYACEVLLNGQSLGKRLWSLYSFNITGILHEGANKLDVIVTNTFANQYVISKVFKKWPGRKLGPYHPRSLKYEKETLSSGLFGPVILR